jgi:hypothetical protein
VGGYDERKDRGAMADFVDKFGANTDEVERFAREMSFGTRSRSSI